MPKNDRICSKLMHKTSFDIFLEVCTAIIKRYGWWISSGDGKSELESGKSVVCHDLGCEYCS
jgi:hypothetical protein